MRFSPGCSCCPTGPTCLDSCAGTPDDLVLTTDGACDCWPSATPLTRTAALGWDVDGFGSFCGGTLSCSGNEFVLELVFNTGSGQQAIIRATAALGGGNTCEPVALTFTGFALVFETPAGQADAVCADWATMTVTITE